VEERLLYRRQVVEITLHRGERRLALGIAESRYYHRGENADDDDYGKHLDEGEPRADVLAVASHGGTLRRVPVAGTTSLRMSLLSRYVAVPKGTNAGLVFRCQPVWSDTDIHDERDGESGCALHFASDQMRQRFRLALWRFEHELVVHLEKHVGLETFI